MKRKIMLAVVGSAFALACFGTGTSSGATLYTTAAHTTPVAVGTAFTASITEPAGPNEWGYKIEAPPTNYAGCRGGSYSFKVTQNSGGVFKAAVTGGSLTGCYRLTSPVVQPWGELKVEGSATVNGTMSKWSNTTLSGTLFTTAEGSYLGNFPGSGNTGNQPHVIEMRQPLLGSPATLALESIAQLGGPIVPFGAMVTASYVFNGSAGAYSFN